MKRALLIALALAACTPPAPDPAPASSTEAAPRAVTIHIDFAANGQSVEVPVGEPFSVVLPGEEALGLTWQVQQLPAFVSAAPEGSVTSSPTTNPPGAPGEAGRAEFFFVANAAGSEDLSLAQRNFDGSENPGGGQFRVTIVAR